MIPLVQTSLALKEELKFISLDCHVTAIILLHFWRVAYQTGMRLFIDSSLLVYHMNYIGVGQMVNMDRLVLCVAVL